MESRGAYLERMMSELERRNPEEFKRLKQLRELDPQAFRAELRKKLQEMRRNQQKHGDMDPRDLNAPGGMRPGERSDVGCPRMSDDPQRKAREEDMGAVRTAVQKYRQSTDSAEKKNIEEDLRARIVRMVEQRHQERTRRIEQFEQELKRMKADLERMKSEKNEIIEGHLKEILEGHPQERPMRGTPPKAGSPK